MACHIQLNRHTQVSKKTRNCSHVWIHLLWWPSSCSHYFFFFALICCNFPFPSLVKFYPGSGTRLFRLQMHICTNHLMIMCTELCNKFANATCCMLRLSFTSVSHETLLSIYSQYYQVSEDYMSLATELSPSFRYLQYGSNEKLGGGRGMEERLIVFFYSVQRCTQNWHTVITEERKQWRDITNSTCSCSQAPLEFFCDSTVRGGPGVSFMQQDTWYSLSV